MSVSDSDSEHLPPPPPPVDVSAARPALFSANSSDQGYDFEDPFRSTIAAPPTSVPPVPLKLAKIPHQKEKFVNEWDGLTMNFEANPLFTSKANLGNVPELPPRKKNRGPPAVAPRHTSPAKAKSIELKNKLLFRGSGIPEKQYNSSNKAPVNSIDALMRLSSEEVSNTKMKIEVDGTTPMMEITQKVTGQDFFDLDAAISSSPSGLKEETKKYNGQSKPNFSTFDERLFGYVNQARTEPQTLLKILRERLTKFEPGTNNLILNPTTKLVTHEGEKAVREAIEFLEEKFPVKALSWHNTLAVIAKQHVGEIGAAGLYSHQLKDGNKPTDKALKEMPDKISAAAESIKFNSENALSTVIDFIIDDGVPTRGNRNNLFGDYDLMGCFTGHHKVSVNMTTFLFVQSSSMTSGILQTLLGEINASSVDPTGWAQKQQKVLFTGDEITVTNIYAMRDGSQKTIEIKRKVKNKQLV